MQLLFKNSLHKSIINSSTRDFIRKSLRLLSRVNYKLKQFQVQTKTQTKKPIQNTNLNINLNTNQPQSQPKTQKHYKLTISKLEKSTTKEDLEEKLREIDNISIVSITKDHKKNYCHIRLEASLLIDELRIKLVNFKILSKSSKIRIKEEDYSFGDKPKNLDDRSCVFVKDVSCLNDFVSNKIEELKLKVDVSNLVYYERMFYIKLKEYIDKFNNNDNALFTNKILFNTSDINKKYNEFEYLIHHINDISPSLSNLSQSDINKKYILVDVSSNNPNLKNDFLSKIPKFFESLILSFNFAPFLDCYSTVWRGIKYQTIEEVQSNGKESLYVSVSISISVLKLNPDDLVNIKKGIRLKFKDFIDKCNEEGYMYDFYIVVNEKIQKIHLSLNNSLDSYGYLRFIHFDSVDSVDKSLVDNYTNEINASTSINSNVNNSINYEECFRGLNQELHPFFKRNFIVEEVFNDYNLIKSNYEIMIFDKESIFPFKMIPIQSHSKSQKSRSKLTMLNQENLSISSLKSKNDLFQSTFSKENPKNFMFFLEGKKKIYVFNVNCLNKEKEFGEIIKSLILHKADKEKLVFEVILFSKSMKEVFSFIPSLNFRSQFEYYVMDFRHYSDMTGVSIYVMRVFVEEFVFKVND